MNKPKKWFLAVGITFALVAGIYIFVNGISDGGSSTSDREIPVIEITSNIVYKVENNQIGEYADLIVLGVPQDKLEDRKFVINNFPTDLNDKSDTPEAIQDFYSFVNFKVDTVYKNAGLEIGEELSIFERVALITDSEGKKIIKLEGYHELQPQQKYLLFLKKSPDSDYYHIVRNNDGQETISNEENIEQQVQAILKKHGVEK